MDLKAHRDLRALRYVLRLMMMRIKESEALMESLYLPLNYGGLKFSGNKVRKQQNLGQHLFSFTKFCLSQEVKRKRAH